MISQEGSLSSRSPGQSLCLAIALAMSAAVGVMAAPPEEGSRCNSELKSRTPDSEILHIDLDGDGKPDLLERWWNGKRVRWLDESGTLRPDDERGNLVNCVLQVDIDGDGSYDGPDDMNIKWCDTDGDGIPDVQSFSINPKHWGVKKDQGYPIWMIFINHDKHGVLGWVDWTWRNWKTFESDSYEYTGSCDWLPNYHGNCDFVKVHAPSWSLSDPRLFWEDPFSFYDETGDGVSKMALRWCAPIGGKNGTTSIPPKVNMVQLAYDLDANSGYGNETSYDMSLMCVGAEIDTSGMSQRLPNFKGDPKFDCCFRYNQWRRIEEVKRMDRDKGYGLVFSTPWKQISMVFDEDADDHRWERVELMWATTNNKTNGSATDIYSTASIARAAGRKGVRPGLCANDQADSLGDRGEFDMDNSGHAQLYVGAFDRKLHLYGAERGAWTVDRNGEFHGGKKAPGNKPIAPKVGEVVKYTDTDGDGFLDTIEYDYTGSGNTELKVCLLDYKKEGRDPQKATLIEPGKLGWKGMHELFNKLAQESWLEAMELYRAAWRRGLTTEEMDRLAQASSLRQRHLNAYWIKEGVFRELRNRVNDQTARNPAESGKWRQYLAHYVEAYYTGRVDQAIELIGRAPGSVEAKIPMRP